LGLGTTQLYNKRVVYNQKRHGTFPLGNRTVTFERRMNVPRQLSPEFLLVNLVNELGDLAEDIAGRGAAIEAQIDLRLAIPECSMLLNPGERAEPDFQASPAG
jgi:hypothetical protein